MSYALNELWKISKIENIIDMIVSNLNEGFL